MENSGNLVDSLAIPNNVYLDIWDYGGYSDTPLYANIFRNTTG